MAQLLDSDEQNVDNNELHAIYSGHLDLVKFELAEVPDADSSDAQTNEIQTKELYDMAEKVVRFLQEGITKEDESSDISSAIENSITELTP